MLRISALNDSSCSEDDSQKIQLTKTKEAKEAEAFAAYNKALSHQQKGNTLHAEKLLRNLFEHPLLKEASSLVGDEYQAHTLNHPGLHLLYSIHKNLASILLQRGQLQEAIAAYIEAVKIDSSEVTVWFKMGQVAKELHNYPLAKICFQQALQCNPNHWPSLDNAITVTFALGDYLTCLENISTALEKDCTYPKGLAFRKQILSEQPSLESVTKELFIYCDPKIHMIAVDTDETKEYINEALKFRATRRQMILEHQEKDHQPLTFRKPLTPFTWKNVGEQLIDLYDFAVSSNPPKSLALEVDLRDYFFLDHLAFLGENAAQDKQPSPVRAEKGGHPHLSSPSVRKAPFELSHSDVTATFQGVNVKDGRIPVVPQSLNIRDSAKESALIKRIQGDMAMNEVFTVPECPDFMSKVTTEAHSQQVADANEQMVDELELDGVDMNDVPLLQDEDMNMAVLSLKDIRKADFRPELLLKTNDEDFKELRDVRALENVLSTVIDLEMQEMYQKVIPPGEQVDMSSKSGIYMSSLQPETGIPQLSDVAGLNQLNFQSQNTFSSTSKVPDPTVPSSSSDKLFQHKMSNIDPSSAVGPAETEFNTVASLMPDCDRDVSSATISPTQAVHKVGSSPGQTVYSVSSIHETVDPPNDAQYSQAVIHEYTSEGRTSTLPALPAQTQSSLYTHSSQKASVLPSSIHSIQVQDPQQQYQFPEANIPSSLTHTLPVHVSALGHPSRASTAISSHISQTSTLTPQSPSRTISSFPLQNSTPTSSEGPPVWTVNLPTEPLPQSPRTSISSPVQVSQPSSLYYSLIQTSQQASNSFSQASQARSLVPPALSQPNVTSAPLNLLEKSFKSSVLPTDYVHSPITTSLLSPNSSSSCPKLASVYHSVLSSMDQTDLDSTTYKTPLSSQPSQKLDLSLSVNARGTTKSPHGEDNFTSIKSIVHQSPSNALKNMSADEYIADVANQLLREACTDRSPQKTKIHHSNSQTALSAYHSSPLPNPTSAQTPSKHSPHYYQELPLSSQSHALLNTPARHRAPSPNISFPRADAQMCLPPRYHPEHESFVKSSNSFPRPMKIQSHFETERRLDKQVDQRQTSTKRSRPPPLSRSASMPGYYTHTLEHNLLSYLSLPQVPYPLSPFHSNERRSPHIPCQPTPGLVPNLAGLFSPTCSLPCSHPDGSNLFPGPLYSSLSSAPSTFHFPTSTALPPYLTPPRPPKYMVSQHFHQDSFKLASQGPSKHFPDETTTQKARNVKTSPSNSAGHRRFGMSPPAAHAPSQTDHSSQLPPKHAEVTTQLQNLARIAHQVSSGDEKYSAVSGDHSYYQKRSQVFQAMVESLLTGTSTTSRPACSPLTSMSSKGFQPSLDHSLLDASKKRGPTGNRTPGSGAKRGPKRKMDESLSADWTLAYKRRSTRSRNAKNRKEDKSIDYQNMVKKYFPRSLLQLEQVGDGDKNNKSDMDVDENVADDNEAVGRNAVDISSLRKLSDNEQEDVKAFVKKCLKGHGTLDMIYQFLLHLARRFDLVWYEGIADIFVNLYVRLRKHLTVPSLFYGSDDSFTLEGLREYATVILTWSELSLSKAAAENGNKSCLLPSKVGQPDLTTTQSLGEYLNEDMMFLMALTGRDDALGNFYWEFCVRFYWLKARQHHFINETADALECFEIICELLEDVATKKGLSKNNVRVIVPNMSEDPVISLSEANRQLECLRRCRSLEDTQKLFDEAKYDLVVDNLVSTFNDKNLSSKSVVQRERPSQLLLLVNSLYNIGRKTECIQWAEVSLHEAVLHYKRAPTSQLQKDWAATLVSLFDCINRLQDEDETILKTLTRRNLARLSDSLVFVIEVSLTVGEHVTEMPIASLLPWKILYRILKFEEINHDLNKQNNAGQNSLEKEHGKDHEDEKDQRPLLLMLREAHDYLGRHSWCTRDDGSLLLFIMSVVEQEMEGKSEDDLEDLTPMYEQCVYCLYGHPNKRGRARNLSDHNSTQLTLTWERAGPVFRHFATQSVPEFDSYRTSTVTADVENLLRRIFALVPDKINPAQKVAVITDYIEGVSSSAPGHQIISVSKEADPGNISGLLYYLLGDFYFKSKEPTKAIKFYQLDLVLNSNRLDSWAGLALAKMSQIEQKLNSTELKMEKPIHKNSERALKCFQRAVELETGSCKLWLEYGSLAYQLLSHASRQIKYKDMFDLTEEVLQPAMSRYTEMLLLAKSNYQQASKCEGEGTEEGWLIFYMMGKVAEKQQEHPAVYLDHYLQAAVCLHEEKAVYPKKIQFVNPRPHLALEALEIFYRIIVSALKLVLSGCEDSQLLLLESYVTSALQSYFARGEEKQQKTVEEERDGMLVSPAPTLPPSKSLPVYHKNPIDHDYCLHKIGSDLQSEGQSSKCADKASTGSLDVDMDKHEPLDQQLKGGESSSGNVVMDNKNNFPLDSVLLDPDVDMSSIICVEATVGVAGNSCEDSLKQTSVESCATASIVHVEQDIFEDEQMDTCEPAAECEVVSEAKEKPCENDSEEKLLQDEKNLEKICYERDVSQCEISSEILNNQDVKSDSTAFSECRQSSSQEDCKDTGQDVKSPSTVREQTKSHEDGKDNKDLKPDLNDSTQIDNKGDNQDSGRVVGYQGTNQYGSQIEECSQEDTAMMSCGNQADIDTEAMDVDGQGITSASHQTFQDSFSSFINTNQTGKSQVAVDSFQARDIDDIIESHAKESVDKTASVMNITSTVHDQPASEGFTVDSENPNVVSDSIMDTDSFEGNKLLERQQPESCKETAIEKSTDEAAACLQPNIQDQNKSQVEIAENQHKAEEYHVISVRDNIPDKHKADNDISTKCEDVDASSCSTSQKQDSKKESVDVPQDQNKSGDVNYRSKNQADSVLKHHMDAAGDLKESSSQQKLQCHSNADNEEGEKWETEAQEKSKDSLDELPESVKASGVSCEENISPVESGISGAEASVDKSVQPSQELSYDNDSTTVREPDISQAIVSCHTDPDKQSHISPKEAELLKTELLSKCRSGLEMCASRFPCHYKSLYRLAHLYHYTKELDKARDILLGRPDWQEHPYMPAPGLFAERKQNNFFQGLWKIPVEDIDRSGSFATHVHRSVRLLFEVLCDLGDLEMLKNLHNQLRRTPEPGKKYLRDAERLVLADEAFLKCVNVVQQDMQMGDNWSEEQREENLLRVYQVWASGKGCKHIEKMTDALLRAFKIMMKGRTDVNRLTAGQAISFCQQNFSKALAPSTLVPSTAQSKLSSQCPAEKGKDGPVSGTEKDKEGLISGVEKGKDIPVSGVGKDGPVSGVGKDGPISAVEKGKDGPVSAVEKGKDGPVSGTEKDKDGPVSGVEKGEVGPISGIEKAELDQTSSKQTEQQQTHLKQEGTTKAAPITQQSTDSNIDTENPGSDTTYTSIRPSPVVPDHATKNQKDDEDVIILSD